MSSVIPFAFGAAMLALAFASYLRSAVEPVSVSVSSDRIIIDVRTPKEYAAGHLDGARLLDLTSSQFSAALHHLGPDARYLVYCRSGIRSARTAHIMTSADLHVTDLSSLAQATRATRLRIIR